MTPVGVDLEELMSSVEPDDLRGSLVAILCDAVEGEPKSIECLDLASRCDWMIVDDGLLLWLLACVGGLVSDRCLLYVCLRLRMKCLMASALATRRSCSL